MIGTLGVLINIMLDPENIKSGVTFLHLIGLALGVGSALLLDLFVLRYLNRRFSIIEYQFIEYVSKFVLVGLVLLWVSGIAFIAYYYFYTPEFLVNQKVWAKGVIVCVLTLNGLLVHSLLVPKLEKSIGQALLCSLSGKDVMQMVSIGTVSFFSWMFPIVLGVTKTLNFSVPATDIILFYLVVTLSALCVVNISAAIFLRASASGRAQAAS